MEKTKITAKKIIKDIYYLFSKINWAKSWLDADAVKIMNKLTLNIKKLEDENN